MDNWKPKDPGLLPLVSGGKIVTITNSVAKILLWEKKFNLRMR